MKALLIRTGSVPVQPHSLLPGSPRISVQWESSRRRDLAAPTIGIRRALSESHVIRSDSDVSTGFSRLSGLGSRSSPAMIPKDYASEAPDDRWRIPGIGIPVEEIEFSGGGIGKGRKTGGDDDFTGGDSDRSKVGAYYQKMLMSNPNDSLLLRNYGKFLHEVEGDLIKAEEYYGRAILASPGDGEVLSLFGRVIWESHRDEDRAMSYFDLAVNASPDDCMVLGSYAKFMWDAEEDDDEEEEEDPNLVMAASAVVGVEAF